ncbi:MAG: ribulose-phosphate 3-epimerase [Spirochaetales bacterium]|nr:ribulose-phosphate 3-epimerase [Spirochaetales bacterium]MCF7938325.1 ribulose-phosphate 3-epimerase [Spirochaetales bacterium]
MGKEKNIDRESGDSPFEAEAIGPAARPLALPNGTTAISPSMMCADFLHLENEIRLFERHHIEFLHIDIMDGHYVPNLTLGPGFCDQLAEATEIPLDIHLMVEPVDRLIPVFARPGALICFHPEAVYHPLRSLDTIRKAGAVPGVALDPATPLETLRYILPDIDFLLLMTVNPGYSGQKLVPQALDKVRDAVRMMEEAGRRIPIEVDGNVSWENIPKMLDAGADILIGGTSSVFDPSLGRDAAIERIRNLCSKTM